MNDDPNDDSYIARNDNSASNDDAQRGYSVDIGSVDQGNKGGSSKRKKKDQTEEPTDDTV